jgi:hypothetical protein
MGTKCKDESLASLPIDELTEKADGFARVFPGTTMQIAFFLLLLFDRLNSSSTYIGSTYV